MCTDMYMITIDAYSLYVIKYIVVSFYSICTSLVLVLMKFEFLKITYLF